MPDALSSAETANHSADELRALLREAEQVLAAGSETDEHVAELLERVRSAIGRSHSLARIREEALRQARHADQLVRESPYYALGLAAGLGALVGISLARSCRG